MVYLFLAEGFEEIEALTPLDILRRADIEVRTVGVTGKTVTGAHGIPVIADIQPEGINMAECEAVILPGGMPGTVNLQNSEAVAEVLKFAYNNGVLISAICAAPMIIGALGMLKDKTATCFPGFENELIGARLSDLPVVLSDNFITAKGAGAAAEFGFKILEYLKDKPTADKLFSAMQY